MRQNLLEKRAEEIILARMEEYREMEIEEIMDLIRPHIIFDSAIAREQAVRRKAHTLAAKRKDEKGVRCHFAHNGKYVDIERTTDIEALDSIIDRNEKAHYKLNEDVRKAKRRKLELIGQQLFDFEYEEKTAQ